MPNADRAIVTAAKLRHYLLNTRHPVGAAKARLFALMGYRRRNWRELRRRLIQIATSEPIQDVVDTEYGRKYIVAGILERANGPPVSLVTIWIVLRGEDVPKLVTAYPEDD